MSGTGVLGVSVLSVSLAGPGLADWAAARDLLAGRRPFERSATVVPQPRSLSAADRRRAGRVLRLAIVVAEQAAGADAARLATVFASSGADGENCHELCRTLATPQREVSPTRFMNSVHNAPAGYWSLAAHSMQPASALCAHDGSFAAGLLEAVAQVCTSAAPVLLVAYDADYPPPLRAARPIPDAFATALLLAPSASAGALARLELRLAEAPASTLQDTGLETLRGSIPAARGLPLLVQLAAGTPGECVLDYLDELRLAIDVVPC